MKNALEQIKLQAHEALEACDGLDALEALRVKFLGKKGELTAILKQMGKLSAEERPVIASLQTRSGLSSRITSLPVRRSLKRACLRLS